MMMIVHIQGNIPNFGSLKIPNDLKEEGFRWKTYRVFQPTQFIPANSEKAKSLMTH